MENILTFIIPVRHQDSSSNWEVLKRNLTSTIKSIAAQERYALESGDRG